MWCIVRTLSKRRGSRKGTERRKEDKGKENIERKILVRP
jgi:hypothetical protein